MSDKSKIEWCDATWNPITGCTKVSEGCRNCYASTFAERWRGTPGHYFENGFDITLRPDKLDQPLKWKRPRKIFVNSMSDLFHEKVPTDYIAAIFAIMAFAEQHTFQVLTKRPERMRELLDDERFWLRVRMLAVSGIGGWKFGVPHARQDTPLPNVWLGTSVENQQAADDRILPLLATPAVVRFLSMEPLLGPVDLDQARCEVHDREFADIYNGDEYCTECVGNGFSGDMPHGHWLDPLNGGISWIIVGGESGPKARPMHPEWATSLRDQCEAEGVPFFFKQWGEWLEFQEATNPNRVPQSALKRDIHTFDDGTEMIKVGKHNAGRLLDGVEWNEFPEVTI